jgi:pimeloyl-ACP methyl ester carboxylesterase
MIDSTLEPGTGWTSHGALSFLMDHDPRTSARPLVVVLHGALRNSDITKEWHPVLAGHFDMLFVDLPGHGYSPADGEPSIPAFILRFRDFVRRHLAHRTIVIVGESVGGLVGLGVSDGALPCIKGVVAADPPMSTGKQWPIYSNFLHRAKTRPIGDYLMEFFRHAFGFTLEGVSTDRLYYPLIARVQVPALILTGDVPLFPVRTLSGIPCLLDDVDRTIIAAFAKSNVTMKTIKDAGHLCLDASKPDARAFVSEFCAKQLLAPEAQRAAG